MLTNDGVFRQRVGTLVENYICNKFDLQYNKRQQTRGHYDAYNTDNIFEIKASNSLYNTFILKVKNHKLLIDNTGSYIFVSYKLKNRDKDLSVISDILIEKIYIIPSVTINKLIIKYNVPHNKDKRKNYVFKIQLSTIERLGGNIVNVV